MASALRAWRAQSRRVRAARAEGELRGGSAAKARERELAGSALRAWRAALVARLSARSRRAVLAGVFGAWRGEVEKRREERERREVERVVADRAARRWGRRGEEDTDDEEDEEDESVDEEEIDGLSGEVSEEMSGEDGPTYLVEASLRHGDDLDSLDDEGRVQRAYAASGRNVAHHVRQHSFEWDDEWSDGDADAGRGARDEGRRGRRPSAFSLASASARLSPVRQTRASQRRLQLQAERARARAGAAGSRPGTAGRDGYGGRLGVRLAARLAARYERDLAATGGVRLHEALRDDAPLRASSQVDPREGVRGPTRQGALRSPLLSEPLAGAGNRGEDGSKAAGVPLGRSVSVSRRSAPMPLGVSFARDDGLGSDAREGSDGLDAACDVWPREGVVLASDGDRAGAREVLGVGRTESGRDDVAFGVGASGVLEAAFSGLGSLRPPAPASASSTVPVPVLPRSLPSRSSAAALPVQIAQTYTRLCEMSGSADASARSSATAPSARGAGGASARSSAAAPSARGTGPAPVLPETLEGKALALEALRRALGDETDRIPADRGAVGTATASVAPPSATGSRADRAPLHRFAAEPSATFASVPSSAQAGVPVSAHTSPPAASGPPIWPAGSRPSFAAPPPPPARTLRAIPPARTSPREVAACDRAIMANRLDAAAPRARRGQGLPRGLEKAPGWLRVLVAAAAEEQGP